MAIRFAPHAHTVKVRNMVTGQVDEIWPVDARERVTHPMGGWEYTTEPVTEGQATADTPNPVAATPPPSRSAVDLLDEMSYTELKGLAKKVGIIGNLPKADLVAALAPHVDSKALELNDATGLPSLPYATTAAR